MDSWREWHTSACRISILAMLFFGGEVADSRRLSITQLAPMSKLRLELRQLGGISKKDLILDLISQCYLNIQPIIRTLPQSRS